MFQYNKFLEYPIRIKNPNPQLANIVITQYGGAYAVWYSFFISAFLKFIVTV